MLYSSPYKMLFDLTIKGNKLLGLFFLKPFVGFSKEMEQSRKSSLLVVMFFQQENFLKVDFNISFTPLFKHIFFNKMVPCRHLQFSNNNRTSVICVLLISTSQTFSSFPIKTHIFKGVKVCLTCFSSF